jgi:hypothetical protein
VFLSFKDNPFNLKNQYILQAHLKAEPATATPKLLKELANRKLRIP